MYMTLGTGQKCSVEGDSEKETQTTAQLQNVVKKTPSETSIRHCAEAPVSKLCKRRADGVTVWTAAMAETDSLSLCHCF